MAYDFLYEVSDGVATLTLNRPEVMNALTFEVYAQLRDLLQAEGLAERTDSTQWLRSLDAVLTAVKGTVPEKLESIGQRP